MVCIFVCMKMEFMNMTAGPETAIAVSIIMAVYNEERFHVTYQSFAWNQIPDIYVVERGATEP